MALASEAIDPGADPLEAVTPAAVPEAAADKQSYSQILKSSAVIGGSSIVNIGVGIVRAKAMALLLGPAGVGLVSLYMAILNLAGSIASMGINTSGVRQIAEAIGSGEDARVGRTAVVLRRTAVLLGLFGAILLALFSRQISILTFGNDEHTGAVALLSVALFFGQVAGGQAALIQGVRRIADLARMGIIGGFCGALMTILLVYWFREKGIIPSIVAGAAVTSFVTWWYRRKVKIPAPSVTKLQWKCEVSALLKLGLVFSASSILTMGAAYAIRLIVLRKVSFEAAGLYQSAWTIGGLYTGFILQAMLTDFYPRLSAVAADDRECNRLVNEQAEISLLLAGPGVIATMTFAPLVVALFYSTRFAAAVEPLRWICFGMALRVIAWPMGFIIVAKGIQTIFFWTEVAAAIVHVGLAYVLVGYFGLAGAAMAFFGLYIWHGVLIYVIVRRLTRFQWSALSRQCMLVFLPASVIVFGMFHWLPFWVATAVGALTAIGTGIYSIRLLLRLVPLNRSPRMIRQLLGTLRIAPNGAA